MRDYLTLGSAPTDEECVQVTDKDFYIKEMKEECLRYARLLNTKFPNRPEGCTFSIRNFPHDFGNYYEVVVNFDNENEEQMNYAFEVENNLPERWD